MKDKSVLTTITAADQFGLLYGTKLIFNIEDYKYTGGPNFYTSPAREKKEALCQYEIKFNDGSTIRVIMNKAQYYGIKRSTFVKANIFTIGGEGHRILNIHPITRTIEDGIKSVLA